MTEQTEAEVLAGEEIQHPTTFDAMQAILRDLGIIAKTRSTNSQSESFNYTFRGIEELLQVFNPLCKKHGLLTPTAIDGEVRVSEYQARNSTMHWVMVPTVIRFQATTDPDDVIIGGPFLGEASDAGDKAATKAQSVAWREIVFKTFSVPTKGEDYDTEHGNQDDRAALSAADKSAAAEAEQVASAKERGWDDMEDLEAGWETLRKFCTGKSSSADWARKWSSAHGYKMGTLTATALHEMEATMGMAKQDGEWRKDFTPPPIPGKEDS